MRKHMILVALFLAALPASRCENIPGTLDKCGAYRHECLPQEGGGCCAQSDTCALSGGEPRCVFYGPFLPSYGATADGGAQREERVTPRLYPKAGE